MRILKTITNFALRLVLFMPLALLAYLCDGLRLFFERLSDGLFDMAKATRQMTEAPYVRDIKASIEQELEERRLAALQSLREHLQ